MRLLSKCMMVLTLGTVVSLCGAAGCKKNQNVSIDEILFMLRHSDPYHNYYNNASVDPPLDPPANLDPPAIPDPPVIPNPIPGSLVLFGTGAVGMGLWGWRKRSKR